MQRIDFSGIDGCGKSTQVTEALQFLADLGYSVRYLKEVGHPDIPACAAMRELILNPRTKLSGQAFELICAAMRIENLKLLNQWKAEGVQFVVSDRGYIDHLAYGDVNCSEQFMDALYHCLMDFETPAPAHTILFNLSTSEAALRRIKRNGTVDAIEAKGDVFMELVSQRFKARAQEMMQNPSTRVHVIDASQPQDVVTGAIQRLLVNECL